MTQQSKKTTSTTKKTTKVPVEKKATKRPASKIDTQKAAAKMCVPEKEALRSAKGQISALITGEDLRTAILIVSVIINLFFLIAWVTLQVTDQYDEEVISFLFNRTLIR